MARVTARPAPLTRAVRRTPRALAAHAGPIVTGAIAGVIEVAVAVSFSALVFAGPAAEFLPAGTGLTLFAAMAVMLVTALRSSLQGAIGSVQDSTAAILALVVAGSVAGLPRERVFPTAVLAIVVCSVTAGAVFYSLGRFRLGNLIRFVPYPVIGGFLAGTGWLLLKGGMSVLTGLPFTVDAISRYGRGEVAAKWLPGLAFAVVFMVVARRVSHPLLLPGAIVGAIALFYVSVAAAGSSPGEAESGGWLIGPFPDGALWRLESPGALANGDWGAVLGESANILTLVVIAVLSMLLNASGIEIAVRRDLDINRELRTAGTANAVAGAAGGMPGFHALSLTALAHRSGAGSRIAGVTAAAVCGLTLLIGASVLGMVPKVVLGGVLLVLGFGFLWDWIIDAARRMPRAEHLIALAILVVVATLGYLQGVALGIVAAIILFVVNYSRNDVVKHSLSGAAYRSRVERPEPQRQTLRAHGDRIFVMELQGFIFFGTANNLFDRIRARAQQPEDPLEFLLLDFRRVTGLDSSAMLSFSKAGQLAEASGFDVVITAVPDDVRRRLEHAFAGLPALRFFPDLDRGIEWCEDRLLEIEGPARALEATSFVALWRDRLPGADVRRFLRYLERREISAGETLIEQGSSSDDLYFLELGQLTASRRTPGGRGVRLMTMGPGTVVGELTMYLGRDRTASVAAECDSVVYRLSRDSFLRMERRNPALAAAMHRFFAGLIAERLADTLNTVEALLD